MRWWIYKCNSRRGPHQRAWGDWGDFWAKPQEQWGSSDWIPALAQLEAGDMIIAYQTDKNELSGIARVARPCKDDRLGFLYLTPVRQIGVKVRPLKARFPRVGEIGALQPGPVKTVYPLSDEEATALLDAADAERGGLVRPILRKAGRS